MMEIFKDFTFDAAHSLPFVPDDHKCKRMHGHTYRVRVVIRGELDARIGWVKDFSEIKTLFAPIKEQLDHHNLNEIKGLENPTAEHLAIWIWRELIPNLPELKEIWIFETPSSGCVYRGGINEL